MDIPEYTNPSHIKEFWFFAGFDNPANRTITMAGKPKSMSQIKQLLLLHQQGRGRKTIVRILGMSKNTVRSYLEKLQALTHGPKAPVSIAWSIRLENPELEAKFHAGNPSYKDDRYEHFKSLIPYFLKELKRKGVSKYLLMARISPATCG